MYSYHVFYAIITLLMQIKIPQLLIQVRNWSIKKANLTLRTRQISFNTDISITEILKSSRVEVKKTSKQKISSEVFPLSSEPTGQSCKKGQV